MIKSKLKFLLLIVFLFIFSCASYAGTFSRFTTDWFVDNSQIINAGDSINFDVEIKNHDENKTIMLMFDSSLNEKIGWYMPSDVTLLLTPEEEFIMNVVLSIPVDACNGLYSGLIRMVLIDQDVDNTAMINIGIASGHWMNITVVNGNNCSPQGEVPGLYEQTASYYNYLGPSVFVSAYNRNVIYHDFDGDQVYEPDEDDVPIYMGIAYLYDSSDNLISTTDLSVTNGHYAVPSTALSGVQDFYLVVETDKWNNINSSIKDILWEGNLFVDRKGTYASQQNVYLIEDISNYSEITHNVDLRSRNTDQSGTWDAGSITVGPDDKDQIISPIHWDQLVAGTDFPYVDLDHDGRIDPDDKDHVISPLYWDFPN